MKPPLPEMLDTTLTKSFYDKVFDLAEIPVDVEEKDGIKVLV